MDIEGFIWLPEIVDKLEVKHRVTTYEVESVFENDPSIKMLEKGHVAGENLYRALGQNDSGRYLAVFFILKTTGDALVISARNMSAKRGNIMQKERIKKTITRDPLPESFASISEAAAFWDEHDSADYEDVMEEVNLKVNIKRRVFLVPVAEDVFGAVRKRAKSQGVSTETMLNLLLQAHAG